MTSPDTTPPPDTTLAPPSRTLRMARVALVVLAAAGIAAAYRMGVFAELSSPADLARDIAGMGVA